MAFGFHYFSIPRLSLNLLELIGLMKFIVFMVSGHLGLYFSSNSPASSGDSSNSSSELDPISSRVSQVMTPESVKERLPVVEFDNLVERWGLGKEEGHACAICMRCLDGGDEVRELGNCVHAFHRGCLDSWIDEGRRTCPLCRSKLTC